MKKNLKNERKFIKRRIIAGLIRYSTFNNISANYMQCM